MVKTPLFPLYSRTAAFLKIMDGKEVALFRAMEQRIKELSGTPQETVNWTDPDTWISERLDGPEKALATELWTRSKGKVNPRHVRGFVFLSNGYELWTENKGIYGLTPSGKTFVSDSDNAVTREIDEAEGCLFLLNLVARKRSGKRSDFFDDWQDYLLSNSNYRTENMINESMRKRLVNLVDRKLLSRSGNTYSITDHGVSYLDALKQTESIFDVSDMLSTVIEHLEFAGKKQQLISTGNDLEDKVKAFLRQMLESLKPSDFEHLIKKLLEEMGYADVEVTSPANDKGVDVVAILEMGITEVKEVIQVKRFTSQNVQRPVMDALRGSLHRFGAFRGTIITLSDFSKGTREAAFEAGAAPITLINGEKLIQLLIEHGVGVKKESVSYHTVDGRFFEELESAAGDEQD